MNSFIRLSQALAIASMLAPAAPVLSQIDSLAGSPIRVAKDINQRVVAFPLNDKVNSNFIEAGPLLSSSGKRLYYSRLGHPQNTGGPTDQDIWYNQFNNSTQAWSESINIGAPLNNKGPNFVCEVGWTDDSLLVANEYDKKGNLKAGVSVAVWNGKAWGLPIPVKIKNDYNISDKASYDLSRDRNVLFIAQEKVNSNGKTDLYVAFRDRSSSTKPRKGLESINLGPVINTFGSERASFLTDDGQTLYFSSDGHNGYGGLDVFRSRRLDTTWTNWSKPENLGPGINTPFNDTNFQFTSHSRNAYYSRGISADRSNIYGVSLSELFNAGVVTVAALNEKNANSEPGQTFVIKDAFGDDKAVLNDPAKEELEHVLAYMLRRKNLIVFVTAHSNVHTARKQSTALSDDRLNTVRNYLAANGIGNERIQVESMGHDVVNAIDPSGRKRSASSLEFSFINYGR